MPELPEIVSRAREMQQALVGKTIVGVQVLQPKCLNVPEETFIKSLTQARILEVRSRGKWIFTQTTKGWLLLNLGMGGEILLATQDTLPEKRRLVFEFEDRTYLTINFWWFGYAHYVSSDGLDDHTMSNRLGPNADQVTGEDLRVLLKGRRGGIKSFLLNQANLSGIGNAYIHDILFMARLHPLRATDSLTENEIDRLAKAIHDGLQPSIDKGGAFYEVNLHGKKGGFTADDLLVGYQQGKPCPVCGTAIEKIKTGSTSSFICPSCQQHG